MGSATFFVLVPSGFAKTVSLSWEENTKASQYEFQIENKGAVVVHSKTPESLWKGEVPFGSYTFKVRAIDKFDRPGEWSAPKALVVTPSMPIPNYPSDGQKFLVEMPRTSGKTPAAKAVTKQAFEWRGENPHGKYQLEVQKDGQTVFTKTIEGFKSDPVPLDPGVYHWRVKAVLVSEDAPPAASGAVAPKSWESDWSDITDFSVAYPNGAVIPGQSVQARKLVPFIFSLGEDFISQSGGGSSYSPAIAWVPEYHFSPSFDLTAVIGYHQLKVSDQSFTSISILDALLYLGYSPAALHRFEIDLGGGIQEWVFQKTLPTYVVGLKFLPELSGLKWVHALFFTYSGFTLNGLSSKQFSIGVSFDLQRGGP